LFVRAVIAAWQLGNRHEIDAALDASVVRRFILERAQGRSSSYTKLLAAALRSFLRFLFLHGDTANDLSVAVPPVRRWDAPPVPAFLSPEEVEQVLATPDLNTARGRRAHAMLVLLARLGLRPGEVAGLELEDIYWDQGEIVVRGKGGFCDRMPLSQEVGDALALYLRRDRGHSASRRIFLCGCAPRVGLSGPTAVCLVARSALASAGLRPRGRVGAHIFRHSLATQMIRSGASLSEISQALRHRCLDTTQIYAKVDYETLRAVARPWPVTERP
jgi:site-specific recombinase XerD